MSRQRLVALRLQISPAPGRGASQRRSVAPGDAGPELRPSIKQSEAAGSHHLPPATTNTGTSMKLLLIIGESSPHRSDNKQRKIAFPGINKHANARNCYHIISLQSKKCTAGHEGSVGVLSCMSIFSECFGLLTSVQLAATTWSGQIWISC